MNQTLSIVIPLYKSEANLEALFPEMQRIAASAPVAVELVFVDDGSPDRSAEVVERTLNGLGLPAQLIRLSRNFGSFAAIAAGLAHARGEYCVALAADLQEPPELALEFLERMRGGADVVFGRREGRGDPPMTRLASNLFWNVYRRLVNRDIPPGGVDVFGCTRKVREQICSMQEVETSLVALLFWVGYRRAFVPYKRRPRATGASAWTIQKKVRYLVNSVFSFTDLPMKLLLSVGVLGMGLSVLGAISVMAAKFSGRIPVPGYTATVLTIFFFGGLTSAGLGIVGEYLWLTLQNARRRPLYIVASASVAYPQASERAAAAIPASPPDPPQPRQPSATSYPAS